MYKILNLGSKNYHWNSLKKKQKDNIYLEDFFERLLENLSKKLNLIHKVNYNKKYWRVVVGPWLILYLGNIFDKYKIIKLNSIKSFISYNYIYNLTLDYSDFENKVYNNDKYNFILYDKIVKNIFKKKIKVVQKSSVINLDKEKKSYNLINKLNFFFNTFFFKIITYYSKIIFLSRFLGLKNNIKLKTKLKQINNFYFFFDLKPVFKNTVIFKERNQKITELKQKNKFEKFICENLLSDIPMSYLEYYSRYRKIAMDTNLKKQKIISSIEHINSDFHKIWIAEKIIRGSKLYIYDHSNSLRLSHYDYNHEKKISKKIITNLNYKNSKFKRLPELKFSLKKNETNKTKRDKCSIILYEGTKYAGKLSSCPFNFTNKLSFNHTLNFYKNLDNNIKKQVKFKSPPYTDIRFNSYSKIIKMLSKKKIFKKTKLFSSVINESKIVVCTYPQTTLLEVLSKKIPFIILLNRRLWKFDEKSEEILMLFKKSKLLFFDPKSAAKTLNKNWHNVDNWWEQINKNRYFKKILNTEFSLDLDSNFYKWKKFLN